MQSPPSLIFRLVLFLSLASLARAQTAVPGSQNGSFPSPAMVDGKPAAAWTSAPDRAVYFGSATGANGSQWNWRYPVASEEATSVCLRVVNGHPAVIFGEGTKIRYSRAGDAAGAGWNVPITLNTGVSKPGQFTMEVVDGNPAIAFIDTGNGTLRYMRAQNADGSAWGASVVVDGSAPFSQPSMKVVDGFPAIAYAGFGNLWFRRAADAAGAAWGTGVSATPLLVSNQTHFPSLQVVNGRPAIGYVDAGPETVRYIRATDATGTAWNPPAVVSGAVDANSSLSLAVANGRPALAWYSGFYGGDLRYVEATDSDGDTPAAWSPSVTVAIDDDVGAEAALFETDSGPAVVFKDRNRNELYFYRGAPTAEGTRWPVDLYLTNNASGTALQPNQWVYFSGTNPGQTGSLSFTVTNLNTGSLPATGLSVVIEGPAASEFSVAVPPSATLAAGASTTFTLRYAPVSYGYKEITPRVTGFANGSPVIPFPFRISANTFPYMKVKTSGGSELSDGTHLQRPAPLAGSTTDFDFTIEGAGGADVTIHAITIDGPDAAEFSIVAAPLPVTLGFGAKTNLRVRHSTATGGSKTAVVHMANNIPNSENPFDFTIEMKTAFEDPSFVRSLSGAPAAMALQADGKVLAGGNEFLTRCNPDGSLDPAFFAPLISGGTVRCLAVQKDGRILLAGSFLSVAGKPRPGMARLLADGSLDESFNVFENIVSVACLAVEPDGSILYGREWTPAGPPASPYLARLHADGSPDATFNPQVNSGVLSLALEPGGRIIATGGFGTVASQPANRMARLSAGGALESVPGSNPYSGYMDNVALSGDGSFFVTTSYGVLLRHFANGTRDTSFAVTGGSAAAATGLIVQADGKCLVGGTFTRYGPQDGWQDRPGLARVNAAGTLDSGFAPAHKGTVSRVVIQEDGRIIVGGDLATGYGSTLSPKLLRLSNDRATSVLSRPSPSILRWMRGGTAPEVRDVTFDVKAAGAANWTRLGTAARIAGGWELSGLTLPSSAQFRAQACAGGSVMESVLSILTPLESWRLQHFATSTNTGDAADNADPDKDGLTNFTEFAFGLNPVNGTSGALPEFKHDGTAFTVSFTAPEGRENVIYRAESSPSLQPGSWTNLADTGTGAQHVFTLPGTASRIFVRFALESR
jgi:uncharacterized delta-60 repeat protein